MHWPNAAMGEASFTESPSVLIDTAPIADHLKKEDVDIVTNSIRFRWRDVREQLRTRIDADAVSRDWMAR